MDWKLKFLHSDRKNHSFMSEKIDLKCFKDSLFIKANAIKEWKYIEQRLEFVDEHLTNRIVFSENMAVGI